METVARSEPAADAQAASKDATLIYRQSRWTRLTHWLWAIALFFMGYANTALAKPGTRLFADVRGTKIPIDINPLPFTPHRYRKG